jgi:WXG100 family type VII secretion target
MSNSAPEMGQGEKTLTRAAGMVADAKTDFTGMSNRLDGQIAGLKNKWAGAGGTAFFALHQAWTEKHRVITGALDEFAASLTSTERDNINTDEAQSANYNRTAGRLGG